MEEEFVAGEFCPSLLLESNEIEQGSERRGEERKEIADLSRATPFVSNDQYPSSWQASLLLGLERLNYGKDPRHSDRSKAFELGLKLVADSFKGSGMKSSAAAAAISTSFALENEDYAKVSFSAFQLDLP